MRRQRLALKVALSPMGLGNEVGQRTTSLLSGSAQRDLRETEGFVAMSDL
jgi:hypothetical protein